MGLQRVYDAARFSVKGGKLDNAHMTWAVKSPGEHDHVCDQCKQSRPDIAYFQKVKNGNTVLCKSCFVTAMEYRTK